ncbi:MAG: sigma-70 family RNA polymerase sigma factor [bacterium]|nr:sigma-70 family RNA polymerase sigma factor [bacterium]
MPDAAAELSEAEIATALVGRVAAGDSTAEGELVERYSRGLLYMLRRMTGDPALADDLHQETFRIVLVRLRRSGLEQPQGLAAYLRGTARKLLIAEYRKKARRQTDEDVEAVERAVDPAPSPLTHALHAEQGALVRRLIDELPTDRDRRLLYRFYIAEEDKDKICSDLGLSSLHFNRVLFRARQRFQDLLERFEKRRRLESGGS